MSPATSSDVDPVRDVRRIHVLLEDWLGGIRDDIDPFTKSLSREFTSIAPNGSVRDRSRTLRDLRADRRRYVRNGMEIGIELRDVTQRRAIFGIHLLTFEKRLHTGPEVEAFTCSVLLRETNRVPTGLQWLHLQETPVSAGDEENETDTHA